MKQLLACTAAVPLLCIAFFAVGSADLSNSPKSSPCALITRADATRALGLRPRPGIAAPAGDYAPANAPNTTCAYFGAPKGYVRVTFMGNMQNYQDARKRAEPDVVDLQGIGDAAYWIKGDAESIHAIKHGFAYTVTLHYQSDNMSLANPKTPFPQLFKLAKIAASRL